MKVFLNLLLDIIHELGHVKYDRKRNGETKLDQSRYWKDLEYRLWAEDQAEALVTKWFKYFGFYHLINDAGMLDGAKERKLRKKIQEGKPIQGMPVTDKKSNPKKARARTRQIKP